MPRSIILHNLFLANFLPIILVFMLSRLVGIMLQISIIILFQISLKISSLCSILFFLCYWFYHYILHLAELLSTLFIYVASSVAMSRCIFTAPAQELVNCILHILKCSYIHTELHSYIIIYIVWSSTIDILLH